MFLIGTHLDQKVSLPSSNPPEEKKKKGLFSFFHKKPPKQPSDLDPIMERYHISPCHTIEVSCKTGQNIDNLIYLKIILK